MSFASENRAYLIYAYTIEMKSSGEMAEELSTNLNKKISKTKVLRALHELNVPIRSGKEASKVAYANGTRTSPTKGKKRPEGVREKISKKRAEVWKKCSSTDMEKIRSNAKERWDSLTEKEKKQFFSAATRALRETAKKGSQLELFLYESLVQKGFDCYHHKKILENEKLEVDLVIPSLRLVIEVDGPTHVLPIYGQERLDQAIKADGQKNGLLMENSYNIIRIRCLHKSMSDSIKRAALDFILNTINSISTMSSFNVYYVEV